LLPRQPKLLAIASTIAIDLDALAKAGIAEVLHRPLDSSELAAVLTRCLHSGRLGKVRAQPAPGKDPPP
jgi:hypothetical protein